MSRCPGQDPRYWTTEDVFDVACPHCGTAIEFWRTDLRRRCPGCSILVANPKLDVGCAGWCRYASGCVALNAGSAGGLLGQLTQEMKRVFGDDQRRISHALEVLRWAEEILGKEGGDPLVVKAAAILHDIGIVEAERKHGSGAGEFQEEEGPAIARAILEKLRVDPERIEHICRIVGSHHSGGEIDTLEFRIVWDADSMVNTGRTRADNPGEGASGPLLHAFRTRTGRALACRQSVEGGEKKA